MAVERQVNHLQQGVDHVPHLLFGEDVELAGLERRIFIRERNEILHNALQKLKEHQRLIIYLKVWQGLTHEEIDICLGKAEREGQYSKKVFSRALAKLKIIICSYFEEYH